jgi:hypothetical protein
MIQLLTYYMLNAWEDGVKGIIYVDEGRSWSDPVTTKLYPIQRHD